MKAVVNRELKVAFSKKAQPVWFRILKWALLIVAGILVYPTGYFWYLLGGLFALAMGLHFFYRYKTKAWTQPYRLWDDVDAGR